MKLVEIYFWDSIFWVLYLPLSLLLQLITGEGTIMGIIFIGLAFTVILSLFLALTDGIIWDDLEPAVVYEAAPEDTDEVVEEPKPVKTRKKRTPKAEHQPEAITASSTPVQDKSVSVESKSLEVKPNEQKETRQEPESPDSSRPSVGVDEEPKPKMWTDVGLDELDLDDDDAFG